MTRRVMVATLSASALAACSGNVSGGDAGSGGDDAGTPDDTGTGDETGACASAVGTNAGAVASFPQGTWTKRTAFIVGCDANGLFAFSTYCTHRGCVISSPSSTGATQCPCHGARFDGNGNVTQGPATSPLPHFAVTVCNGDVYVDTNTTVPASTRTPPQ